MTTELLYDDGIRAVTGRAGPRSDSFERRAHAQGCCYGLDGYLGEEHLCCSACVLQKRQGLSIFGDNPGEKEQAWKLALEGPRAEFARKVKAEVDADLERIRAERAESAALKALERADYEARKAASTVPLEDRPPRWEREER